MRRWKEENWGRFLKNLLSVLGDYLEVDEGKEKKKTPSRLKLMKKYSEEDYRRFVDIVYERIVNFLGNKFLTLQEGTILDYVVFEIPAEGLPSPLEKYIRKINVEFGEMKVFFVETGELNIEGATWNGYYAPGGKELGLSLETHDYIELYLPKDKYLNKPSPLYYDIVTLFKGSVKEVLLEELIHAVGGYHASSPYLIHALQPSEIETKIFRYTVGDVKLRQLVEEIEEGNYEKLPNFIEILAKKIEEDITDEVETIADEVFYDASFASDVPLLLAAIWVSEHFGIPLDSETIDMAMREIYGEDWSEDMEILLEGVDRLIR